MWCVRLQGTTLSIYFLKVYRTKNYSQGEFFTLDLLVCFFTPWFFILKLSYLCYKIFETTQVQSVDLVSEVNEVGLELTHRKYEDSLHGYPFL